MPGMPNPLYEHMMACSLFAPDSPARLMLKRHCWRRQTCTIYDAVPGLPVPLRAALSLFNDVILREAIRRGLPVLDLRMVCTEPADYSEDSPIEPSSQGGAKLADRLVAQVVQRDFKGTECSISR